MIRRPPRSTQSRSSAASDVYKRQWQHGDGAPASLLGRYERIPGERDGSRAPHAGAADDLTRGWPLPVKQGGHFRRNGVAISRETGWPKPVKSAMGGVPDGEMRS